MDARDHKAGDMGDVAYVVCAYLFCDLAEYLEIDFPRVGGAAGDDDFRPVFLGQVSNLVIVESASGWADAILH